MIMARNKLNLDHGFMQSIIKNQVDRDNYDKEMKAKQQKEKVKLSCTNGTRPKKPNLMPYVPPVSREQRQSADLASKVKLFMFEFEDQNGDIYGIPVFKDDDATMLSRKIGTDCGLSGDMTRTLAGFLRTKMKIVQEPEGLG